MPRDRNVVNVQRIQHRWGDLLDGVLDAQQTAADLLSGSQIADSARALVSFVQRRGCPVLVPVSPMANRLVGAALIVAGGSLRAADEGSVPLGEDVLLVEAVAAGSAGLRSARELMLSLGAARVECVALRILDRETTNVHAVLANDPLLCVAR